MFVNVYVCDRVFHSAQAPDPRTHIVAIAYSVEVWQWTNPNPVLKITQRLLREAEGRGLTRRKRPGRQKEREIRKHKVKEKTTQEELRHLDEDKDLVKQELQQFISS